MSVFSDNQSLGGNFPIYFQQEEAGWPYGPAMLGM